MRRLSVMSLVFILAVPAPCRAEDEEIGQLLLILGAGLIVPLGALVAASPFYVAAAIDSGTFRAVPRPTGGSVRMLATFRHEPGEPVLVHMDMGGYPTVYAGFGWESRADMISFGVADRRQLLHLRWDGMGLWRLTHPKASGSVEGILGYTAWPTLDGEARWDWTGGPLGGVRLGTWTGGPRILRFEAEALWLGLGGGPWRGLGSQIELRASAAVHIRFHPLLKPDQEAETAFGLAYRHLLPLSEGLLVPDSRFLLWNLTF